MCLVGKEDKLPKIVNCLILIPFPSISLRLSIVSSLESFLPFPDDFTRGVLPIPCHSHNDYWRDIPLFDAIAVGCTSNSRTSNGTELYIGHDSGVLTADRTLRAMYLDPLMYILDQINSDNPQKATPGGILESDCNATFVVLLDFKNKSPETDIWKLVQAPLQPLREKNYLTYWNSTLNTRIMRPLTIVTTGDAPFDISTNLNSTSNINQDIFYDAPLDKLEATSTTYTTANLYCASVSLADAVGKAQFGISSSQLKMIDKQINTARDLDLVSRYWDTAPWPLNIRNGIWSDLLESNVGIMNLDQLWAASARHWTLCWGLGWGICA
ncbi:hypothetical protein BJ878DRAFT_537193 [Calycina marina]|uniref:Altered inheritance of mitochondria protein 6 n=1 Tax=Calycina marina TaxID=1763456 RepID=A0A9P7YW40_9HELO|nr:hypothetical protein BJ878DRAFT_537193 [Calycina marina]